MGRERAPCDLGVELALIELRELAQSRAERRDRRARARSREIGLTRSGEIGLPRLREIGLTRSGEIGLRVTGGARREGRRGDARKGRGVNSGQLERAWASIAAPARARYRPLFTPRHRALLTCAGCPLFIPPLRGPELLGPLAARPGSRLGLE